MNLAGASIWYLQQADRAVKRPDLAPETREILIGSAVAGFLVQYLGYEMMYFCFAGFPVLGIIIYFLYRPTIKRTLAQFGAA